MNVFVYLLVIMFAIYMISYQRSKWRIRNGFFIDCLLGLAICELLIVLGSNDNWILYLISVFIILVILFIAIFGIYILLAFLLISSIRVLRRESHSLANMLTLVLSVIMIIQMGAYILFPKFMMGKQGIMIMLFVYAVEFIFIVSITSFLTIAFFVLLHRPNKSVDYIIVLGSGLLNGNRVSPLLAGRINCGIKQYQKQLEKGKNVKIIFSGGQGADELIAEGEAMKLYALSKGVTETDIMVEDQSKNTSENMRYSKQIMDTDWKEQHVGDKKYRCCFVTNGYHVFRAGIFAEKEGLKNAIGLGSRTAGYFLPNALLREYIAIIRLTILKR